MRSTSPGWLLAGFFLCGAAPVTQADPYSLLSSNASPIQRMVRDVQFGAPGAEQRLSTWLAMHRYAPKAALRLGYHSLCTVYGVQTRYRLRRQACAAEHRLGGPESNDAMLAALSDQPPIRAIGSAQVPLSRNEMGVTTAPVTVNGVTINWMVDTGAQITTLARSTAARLHVRLLGVPIKAGTTTADTRGELAMIDRLRIGNAIVEHVPALVLPDAALGMAGRFQIPAVLGLPVLNAFHRMAWLDHATVLVLGSTAPQPHSDTRIYWHDLGIGIPIETTSGTLGAHFDSGSNLTLIHPSFIAKLPAAERAGAKSHDVQIGGAGGIVSRRELAFPNLVVPVAGKTILLHDAIGDSRSDPDAGRFGMDLVYQTKMFVLDFDKMTMRVEQ